MKYVPLALAVLLGLVSTAASAQSQKVTVLELFTSQGCSSCPPADALLKHLSQEDASLLPLSFHVDYWDNPEWKDPFSKPQFTQRQHDYADALGDSEIYTPELIVDGAQAMVGSRESAVRQAIARAKTANADVAIKIAPAADADQLAVTVSPSQAAGLEIYEIRYDRIATTDVTGGENGGRKLNNINNVTSFKRLGTLQKTDTVYSIHKPASPSEGIAIIAQKPHFGAIINAACYPTGAAL